MSIRFFYKIIFVLLLLIFSNISSFACGGDNTADFSVDNYYPVTGEVVTFTDQSDGAEAWRWNFGNGATPTSALTQGPHQVIYSTTGWKTVVLEIRYDGSEEDDYTDYINVGSPPTAGVIGSNQYRCGNFDPANITSVTDGGGSGTLSYQWEYSVSPFTSWNVITGANNEDYNPGNISQTTYYRRRTRTVYQGVTRYSAYTDYVIKAVEATPVAPTSASSDRDNFCYDDAGNISLSVTGGSGNTVRWFTGSCGGTDIGTGNPLSIASPAAATTYLSLIHI